MADQQLAKADKAEGHKGKKASAGRMSLSASAPAHPILALQQTIGNQAVLGLLSSSNAHGSPQSGHFPPIQRKCECGGRCPECAEEAKKIQRKSDTSAALLPADVTSVIQRKGEGSPLNTGARSFMESRLGHDFSNVRTHTDAAASQAARQLHAQAFTAGRDIYFGAGRFQPGTREGQKLLAHELTHVVQQRSGAVGPPSSKPIIDTPGDVFEQQADAAGEAVVRGEVTPRSVLGRAPAVQRAPDDGLKGKMREEIEVPVDEPLKVPALKASPRDKNNLKELYTKAAGAKALRSTHAGRSTEEGTSTETLWNKWVSTRPFPFVHPKTKKKIDKDEMIELKKNAKCQVDHIIELQVGGADDPNNMRLLNGGRNMHAGSIIAGQLKSLMSKLKTSEEEKPILRFDKVEIVGSPEEDKDCLDWELDAGGAAGPEVEGAAKVEATLGKGGNEIAIFFQKDKGGGSVLEVSQYAVPGFQLAKVKEKGASWELTGAISPNVKRIPVLEPKSEYLFKVAKAGAPITLVDKDLKSKFPFLSEAVLHMDIDEGELKAKGILKPTLPVLRFVEINLLIQKEELSGTASVPPEKLKRALPIPGLEITESTLGITFGNGQFAATGGFALKYSTIADGRVDAKFGSGGFEATGTVDLHIPGLDVAQGQVWVREGKLGGQITLGADKVKIPGVTSAGLVVTIQDGHLQGEGTVTLAVPGVREGKLRFRADQKGNYAITGAVALDIPGLKSSSISLTYRDGDLEGEGKAALAIPGLEGAGADFLVKYAHGSISGTGKLSYKKGKLNGELHAALSEKGKISGGGELAYEVVPGVVAAIGVEIREDGTMKVSGEIRVPEKINLFEEKKIQKTLLKTGPPPIPLFAIPVVNVGLVAKIEFAIEAAAGIGPGELRKVKVKATFDPSSKESPFEFAGGAEVYVPAFAELALKVYGGIGLGAAVATATGGIELTGALGLQGALTSGIQIAYKAGQLIADAFLDLSAQPVLKFKIKAVVKVDVIVYGEAYRKEWDLAAKEWGSGLKLGVRVPVHYESGKPFQFSTDQIEFTYPKIDVEQAVKDLLPS